MNGDTQSIPNPTVQQAPQPEQPGQSGTQPGAPIDINNLIKAIMSSQQQHQQLAQPVPRPVPEQRSTEPPGYMTGPGKQNWGPERFLNSLGSQVHNAASQFRQAQLAKAESEWNQLNTLMQDNSPQGQQKTQAWLVTNQKALKGMAKALNQDWLNPEKTTVYNQALNNVLAQQGKKAQAKQGIMDLFRKIIGKANQPQLNQQQQQGVAQEIMGKAPAVPAAQDPKTLLDTAKGVLDLEKASAEMRQKYNFMAATDGKIWAINKNDPTDASVVKDKSTGQAVIGQTKPSAAPAVQSVGGVPFGIKRGGKLVTPDSDDWTKDDQKTFDAAMGASQRKQDLRIDPIIADQLGEPPDPAKYQGGKSSPAYGRALKQYGQQAEAIKNQMAGAQGAARAQAYNEYRPLQTYNPETGDIEYKYAKDAIGLTPGTAAEKLLPKSAQIADIDYSSKQMRSAVQNIDKPFTPDQVAELDLALSTGDEGMAHTLMSTLATQNLTEKQQDFVVWASNLNERAMSLRNIAGQGQGAQDTRNAIRAVLPGIQSGNKEMQIKQLDAFDNMVGILKKGIAGVKGAPGSGSKKDADPLGIL